MVRFLYMHLNPIANQGFNDWCFAKWSPLALK
jgi:hypothetical protein